MSDKNEQFQDYFFTDISQVISTIKYILLRIIDYTSEIQECTPSIFDFSSFQQENTDIALSTTASSDFSESSEEKCILNEIIMDDLEKFIKEFASKFQFNENLLILSLMNIDKILENNFIITERNIKNLFLVSMIETQKFYEDESFNNRFYAFFAGITPNQLLQMEIKFFEMMDYNLFVSEKKFYNYKERMIRLYKNNLIVL